MTLLTTVFAAIISTVIWYKNAPADGMKVSVLCWMYWGAALMWLVDAFFGYAELQAEYFTPTPIEILNDLYSRAFRCGVGADYLAGASPHQRSEGCSEGGITQAKVRQRKWGRRCFCGAALL